MTRGGGLLDDSELGEEATEEVEWPLEEEEEWELVKLPAVLMLLSLALPFKWAGQEEADPTELTESLHWDDGLASLTIQLLVVDPVELSLLTDGLWWSISVTVHTPLDDDFFSMTGGVVDAGGRAGDESALGGDGLLGFKADLKATDRGMN